MRTSPLANTGVELPRIVFGTTTFGNLYQELKPQTKLEIVQEMLDRVPGVLALDSAGKYGAGLSLETIGMTLSELQVPKGRVVISNKLGWRRTELVSDEPTFEPGVWKGLQYDAIQDISYDGMIRCWQEGTEFLRGYDAQMLSVHDPDEYLDAAGNEADRTARWNDILEAYRAINDLRRDGKARAIGVGSKNWRVSQRIADAIDLDWVMLATSLTIYRHDPEVLQFVSKLHERGIAVINSSVFHGGFLVGEAFFDYRRVRRDSKEDAGLFQWRDEFHAICDHHKVDPAVACAAFGISHPGISSIALSASHAGNVRTNAAILEQTINNSFWQAIRDSNLIAADYNYV